MKWINRIALASLLMLLLVACNWLNDASEREKLRLRHLNYEMMEKDIVNILMDGMREEIKITAKIEGHYIVYYYTDGEGRIARVPINASN